MRIAILANVPVWTLPGLEHLRHGRHYATWLEPLVPAFEHEALGLELHWITFSKEADRVLEHRAYGQTFHILPRGSLAAEMVTGYVSEVRQVRRLIQRLNPDFVHAWGSEEGYGIAGACSGVSRRLFTLQGCLTDYVRRMGGGFLFRLQALYEKPTVQAYRHATAESPGAAALLESLNPGMRIDVVDYGVNAEFFGATWNPVPKPTVLFVGGVTTRKGIADLIHVAALPECQGINFRILGDGPLRQGLNATSTPNVDWLGQCGRTRVVEELEKAWALAIPTFADTGPTVVKEARVIGLPIITTNAAGTSNYVVDAGCGFVIAPGNRDQLSAAIANVCASREACLALGSKGWSQHRETLRPATTARKLVKIYRDLAETQ